MTPSRNFQDHLLPLDLASYTTLAHPDEFPNRRSGKLIRRNKKAPPTKHASNCASTLSLKAKVHKLCMLPAPTLGRIVSLDFGTPPKIEQYYLTISHLPACTCLNFKEMATKAIGNTGSMGQLQAFVLFVIIVCGLDSDSNTFIHEASFSFN